MHPWVVLKFGGTSVSTAPRWATIADVARQRLAEGLAPVVVCSALSGISDRLDSLVDLAREGRHGEPLQEIRQRHLDLGRDLGLDPLPLLAPDLQQLERLATGLSLTGEATPRLRARIMALGELMSTQMGAAFLAATGLPTRWWDARELLQARENTRDSLQRAWLSANCDSCPDPALQSRLREAPAQVHITQGFIASNERGETVLLGRGGSDTSAAYLGARLQAARVEIWTDVPGMYTADPRRVPSARLLRSLDYEEAMELATMGARVLHPRCIAPLRQTRIPLEIRCTHRPDLEGTRISTRAGRDEARVKAVAARGGVYLVSMEDLGMWQQVGFLADVFTIFARHGLSVDLVATSETNVTASLDASANLLDGETLDRLLRDLSGRCTPRLIAPCATVSLVGTRIRSILHRLGPALELFEEEQVHMVSQAASDLNLTFVVEQDQADRLLARLHSQLFSSSADPELFGSTWEEQFGPPQTTGPGPLEVWWRERREDLLGLASQCPVFVYERRCLEETSRQLQGLSSVDRVLYSVKANPCPEVLAVFHELGLGFECVSPGELSLVHRLFPDLETGRLLYTPNFASGEEYAQGFAHGAMVTLDNPEPLETWPEVFRGRTLFLRLDLGRGAGHHRHVRTAGPGSKFGIALEKLDRLSKRLEKLDVQVVGLHSHSGSGIRTPDSWPAAATVLAAEAERFPKVEVLDLGGGLGVPERPGELALDLRALDEGLASFRRVHPQFQLWIEPGRFLVAQAGVLLARVNQCKHKGDKRFVGLETGMNSLIRPALYGAYHEIVNLSRLEDPASMVADVVGPICETGDVLGHDRRLPETRPGDVVLVATAGAYGRAMSSHYNLREPASERLI